MFAMYTRPLPQKRILSLSSVTATSPQRWDVAGDVYERQRLISVHVMPTRRYLASFENRRLTSAVIACVAWLVLIRRRYLRKTLERRRVGAA